MEQGTIVKKFQGLPARYDSRYGSGSTLALQDELELESGIFNDKLTRAELTELHREIQERLSSD